MAEHAGLGIMEGLDLEKRDGPTHLVLRARPSQHQPLAAQGFNADQFLAQVVEVGAWHVLVASGVRRLVFLQDALDGLHTLLERFASLRRIEYQVADLFPQVALVLPANDADRA